MQMMMPCTHYITIAVVHILYCCFTEMHLCPILELVDVIVIAPFVLDTYYFFFFRGGGGRQAPELTMSHP